MFMLQYLLELVGSKIFLTGYVTGNSTFPKPLNEKEEKIYLDRLKDGDVEAKRVLVERNLRLVAHIVKKYSSNYQNSKEMDDLISIGTIGLIKAIDSFDTNKGIRLATYAAKCIDNEILMFFRNTKKTKGEVFPQDPIGVDKEGNEICLIDILSSDSDSVLEAVENSLQVKELYKKMSDILSPREKEIIKMRYGLLDGDIKTQREIAAILGISRSYVSRIEKRALKKLQKELKSEKSLI